MSSRRRRTHRQTTARRPTPADVAAAIDVATAVRGCTCRPETITTAIAPGILGIEILHADDCPAITPP